MSLAIISSFFSKNDPACMNFIILLEHITDIQHNPYMIFNIQYNPYMIFNIIQPNYLGPALLHRRNRLPSRAAKFERRLNQNKTYVFSNELLVKILYYYIIYNKIPGPS